MSNPTSNFGWQMPTSTDLVTDLPADFEVFGQAVATSMGDLLGGSSGYILSKASATDMDFTWIPNDQGDITGVTAGNGISVTDPTGPVPTVAINTAVTADLTTAQTLTNKTLTSPALTTPTISTLTTNGDLLYGTGSGALARKAIGTTGQVLTVAAGIPSWATPAAASPYLAYTQVVAGLSTTSTTYVDVTSATITFTAPASGAIKLSIEAAMFATGGNQDMFVAFREASTTILERTAGSITNASEYRRVISGIVTGVSAGSHTYKISLKTGNATYTTGIVSITASPVLLTVEAAS